MAYTNGYDYDIFISYSHNDDVRLPGHQKGWVSEFGEYLQNWLEKRRGLRGLKIWKDEALAGNTRFDQVIEDRIAKSALFLVLHSHNYQHSEYCRQELAWFFKHNHGRTKVAGGEEDRLFNVLINNIHYSKWPAEFAGTSGFVFHDASSEAASGDPTSPNDPLIEKQMRAVVDAVEVTLNAFPKGAPPPTAAASAAEDDGRIKLFFGDVPDTLRSFRTRMIKDLGDQVQVLDFLPPPYDPTEHSQRLDELLGQATLSVHLLDQWPGRELDGFDTTYPRLHVERAIGTACQSLVWLPDRLEEEDMEDEAQAEWLRDLEGGQLGDSGFQFIRSSRQAITDQVIQTLAELQREAPATHEVQSFLIDTHQKDQRFAYKLAEMLSEHDLDVEFNKESRDPIKSLSDFESAVREVQNLVIMFGQVAPGWLKGRIQTAVKVVAEQFQMETPLLNNIWVCMLPGNPGQRAIPRTPPLIRLDLLENQSDEDIDSDLVQRLLGADGEGDY